MNGMKAATICLLLVALAACSPQAGTSAPASTTAAPANTPAAQSFADPFAYCASVGTIDTPDARYTGPKVPDRIIGGYKQAAGLEASTEPQEMFQKLTIWRCMRGKVYACNFGANLPCDSKANTSKTPTQAMLDFCKATPNSDFIPMAVTGHDTVYSWHCLNDQPQVLQQIGQVDAEGYLAQIWYLIPPTP